MNKLSIMSTAMAALVIVALAGSASAELAAQGNTQVATGLADLKRSATEMRNHADTLSSFTPNKQLSWQSHAEKLNILKDRVNEMGQSLAELETMKSMANPTQALAIAHARPHLVSVARNLTEAIELVQENRRNIYWGDYGEAVDDLYSHANALHTKLDTILDYEKAKSRLENLELQSTIADQS